MGQGKSKDKQPAPKAPPKWPAVLLFLSDNNYNPNGQQAILFLLAALKETRASVQGAGSRQASLKHFQAEVLNCLSL